jgi:hypothetical protein
MFANKCCVVQLDLLDSRLNLRSGALSFRFLQFSHRVSAFLFLRVIAFLFSPLPSASDYTVLLKYRPKSWMATISSLWGFLKHRHFIRTLRESHYPYFELQVSSC